MRQNDIPIVAKLLQRIKELEECKINPSKHCPHFHKAMVNGVNLIELQAHLDNLIKKVEKQDKMERAYVKQTKAEIKSLKEENKRLREKGNVGFESVDKHHIEFLKSRIKELEKRAGKEDIYYCLSCCKKVPSYQIVRMHASCGGSLSSRSILEGKK